MRPGREYRMNIETYQFKSAGIKAALTSFAPRPEDAEDFAAMIEGKIRRESISWNRHTVGAKGAVKSIKQPKPTQKVGWGDATTLNLGTAMKVAIPSNVLGQVVLLDEAYALLEGRGVGYCPGIEAESYLAEGLTTYALAFKPAEPVKA